MSGVKTVYKAVGLSAMLVLLGTLLSGFVGMALIAIVHPQPAWADTDTFIQNYNTVQTVPYIFGVVLILGSCFFVASTVRLAQNEKEKMMGNLALVLIAVYATLISINYILQIAYVPAAIQYNREAIPMLTMSNPSSISWAIEMFGYGFQGVAMWLLAPLFKQGVRAGAIRWLLVLNGVVSIAGAVLSCIDIAWCMKPYGIAMFVAWNLLFMAVMLLVYLEARKLQKKAEND